MAGAVSRIGRSTPPAARSTAGVGWPALAMASVPSRALSDAISRVTNVSPASRPSSSALFASISASPGGGGQRIWVTTARTAYLAATATEAASMPLPATSPIATATCCRLPPPRKSRKSPPKRMTVTPLGA